MQTLHGMVLLLDKLMAVVATGARDYQYTAVELGRSLWECWGRFTGAVRSSDDVEVDAMERIGATFEFASIILLEVVL